LTIVIVLHVYPLRET